MSYTCRMEISAVSRALKAKRTVTVHLTFIKIGEINTLKECFEADVMVRSRWREPELDHLKSVEGADLSQVWTPKLYIDNTMGEPKVTTRLLADRTPAGETYVTERRRVKGSFVEKLELWEFPFDVQDLSVVLMSELPSQDLALVEDPDEIHKVYKQSFIDEQEWLLYKYIESEKAELARDLADPSVTRMALTVRCRAARRPWYFIWNNFSVTFLICCLAFVTFCVDKDKPQNRLQLSFTLVLTAVAFKFVVNQNLPKVSYLTYLDRYILAAMILLAGVCAWHGLQTFIPTAKYRHKDVIAVSLFAAAYIIYNIQFWIRILLLPFRKRRTMKKKQTEYVATVREQAEKSRSGGHLKTLKKQLRKKSLTNITWSASKRRSDALAEEGTASPTQV